MIKWDKVFKDYLKGYYDKMYKGKINNEIYLVSDDNKHYFHNGKIMVVRNDNKIPFTTGECIKHSYANMMKCYCEKTKQLEIVSTINIDNKECYVFEDLFGNAITYCDRKMIDNWLNVKECNFFMNNLDNKSPIYFTNVNDELLGLILPIVRK